MEQIYRDINFKKNNVKLFEQKNIMSDELIIINENIKQKAQIEKLEK